MKLVIGCMQFRRRHVRFRSLETPAPREVCLLTSMWRTPFVPRSTWISGPGCSEASLADLDGGVLGQEPCAHRVSCVALDLSAEFGILRQNEPMVVVTTVVSLVLYTLA